MHLGDIGSVASCIMGNPCEGNGSGLAKVACPWDPGASEMLPTAGSKEQQVHMVLFSDLKIHQTLADPQNRRDQASFMY